MVKRDSQETTQESVSSRSEDDSRKDVPEQMNTAERQSFLELTRNIAGLPLEQSVAALETSAAIAGISLRAAIEFLRATPAAAEVLQPAELRSWGDLGRRLAMSDFESAVTFFAEGIGGLRNLPRSLHASIFQLCSRQMTLSTAVGRETFRKIPLLAAAIADPELFQSVLEIAAEVSRRSAKHSSEFL